MDFRARTRIPENILQRICPQIHPFLEVLFMIFWAATFCSQHRMTLRPWQPAVRTTAEISTQKPHSDPPSLLPDPSLPHTTGHRCRALQAAGERKELRARSPEIPFQFGFCRPTEGIILGLPLMLGGTSCALYNHIIWVFGGSLQG